MTDNSLAQIECHVDQLLERLREVRNENAHLKRKIEKLTEELEGIKQGRSTEGRKIEELRQERKEIRSRLERIKEHLSILEQPVKEKTF